MTSAIRTVIYPVKNLARAKILYGNLVGAEPYMDEPYYVGFSVEGQDVGLDPHGHSQGMTGPVGYWHVDDIKESLKARSEEHTSELQSRQYLVCRLLLEKKKNQ